jgi:hypothetical protein
MAITGLNLLAADHNAGAILAAMLKQDGGQGASAQHGSESINNLAQSDVVEQAEESTVATKLVSKKVGSPTNINGEDHAASGRGLTDLGQCVGQEAAADFESCANNNQSQDAVIDQKEKVSTNLDVDVLAQCKPSCLPHVGCGPVCGPACGTGKYKGPDSIDVDLDNHCASSDLRSATDQDGAQLAKANHGSESINNLAQNAVTDQSEDVSVNANVKVGGPGTTYGGPTVVDANNHTASGSLQAASSQKGVQTALSDNGSVSINNMSQNSFTHQNEKVGVYTCVLV